MRFLIHHTFRANNANELQTGSMVLLGRYLGFLPGFLAVQVLFSFVSDAPVST
jgi:hypothetical protein